MADAPDPSVAEQITATQPIPPDIPFARPVTIQEGAGLQLSSDEFLLLTSTRREAWADIGALVVCLVLLELSAGAVLGLVAGLMLGSEGPDLESGNIELQRMMLFPMLTLRAIFSIAIVGLIIHQRRQPARSVGLRRRGIALDIPIGLAAAVVAAGLTHLAMLALWMIGAHVPEQMAENAERIFEMMPRLRPLGFVSLAVIIGVYEELVFRGFLMVRLRRATGSWTAAVLISGVVFTGLHALDQVTVALVAIGILALVFSVTTVWRRSIVPAIIAHTLWNLSQFLYLYLAAGDEWT